MKGTCCVAAAVTVLCVVPFASADPLVSVGYRTPEALHGLRVVPCDTALQTADVRIAGGSAERGLRTRPGIRFVQRAVARSDMNAPAIPLSTATAVPE